jgi:hypothetical protein
MKVGLAPKTSALTLFSGLGRTYQASTVLPFYSHTRRDDVEKTVDGSLGIDRRCFSNLFPCPIALPARLKEVNGTTLLLFSFFHLTNRSCINPTSL